MGGFQINLQIDEEQQMKLMEKILSQENLKIAIKKVKKNKVLNAKLNKKKNKENSQNKRKSLIKVNE